jgi:hypothetical protein
MRYLLTVACFGLVAATQARAASLTDWNISPASAELGDWTATMGGSFSGAAYDATQADVSDRIGVTGTFLLAPRAKIELDNGWELGFHSTILAYHDELSGDAYGDRVVEKAYASLQTQYGRVEAGRQDGAATAMSMTGPKVDDAVAIDDGTETFFREPTTGNAFVKIFPLWTDEFASANFAKLSYYSPRLFGVQFGASYAPAQAGGGPALMPQGQNVADRQSNLFESAVNYMDDFGPASVGFYTGAVAGESAHTTSGHAGLLDWGVGGEIDYDFGDVKLAGGGSYRQSNAYAFAIDDAFREGNTHSARLGVTITSGPWIGGLEYSTGGADAEATLPALHRIGYEPSIAYVVNSNLQLTLGWQFLRFTRSEGDFYSGAAAIRMQAAFLHVAFQI